ncbi:hypothetical protein SDC9_143088 [bioreactor metagenome]|uniref:Uncharacterized protein n=1 Tax=bioreactor metagenome TaxID=1076179 RepID=A0A645E5T7_9ZZZZ
MPVSVVIGLEPIDIDEQQRKSAVISFCPAPFVVDDFIEFAAVAQASQSVGTRQHRQFGLCAHAAFELRSESERQANESHRERRHDRGYQQGSLSPGRVNIGMRLGHHDDEWQAGQILKVISPLGAIEVRRIRKAAFGCRHELPERACIADIAPDDSCIEGLPHHHGSIFPYQGQRSVFT